MISDLEGIVRGVIQPVLKSGGFKTRGLRWNRNRGDFVDVVTVQEAKYSTAEKQVFTLNLGVFVKSFYEAVWQKPSSGLVTEADCAIRVRLGDLVQGKPYGDALDQWWEIENSTHTGDLAGREIENALRELGLPFLERFDNFRMIADHLQKIRGWQAKNPLTLLYRALAEWEMGDSSSALETLTVIKGKAWELKADVVRDMFYRRKASS